MRTMLIATRALTLLTMPPPSRPVAPAPARDRRGPTLAASEPAPAVGPRAVWPACSTPTPARGRRGACRRRYGRRELRSSISSSKRMAPRRRRWRAERSRSTAAIGTSGNGFKYVAPNYYGTVSNGFIAFPTPMTGDFSITAQVTVTTQNKANNACGIGVGLTTGFAGTDSYAYVLMRNSNNSTNGYYVSAAGGISAGAPTVAFTNEPRCSSRSLVPAATLPSAPAPVGGTPTRNTVAASLLTNGTAVVRHRRGLPRDLLQQRRRHHHEPGDQGRHRRHRLRLCDGHPRQLHSRGAHALGEHRQLEQGRLDLGDGHRQRAWRSDVRRDRGVRRPDRRHRDGHQRRHQLDHRAQRPQGRHHDGDRHQHR